MSTWPRVVMLAAGLAAVSSPARATEPWSDADPPEPPQRYALTRDFGVRAGAEYRAQWLYVNPIALAQEERAKVSWIEHRLRLDAAADYLDRIKIVLSSDVLDGVLWGDNGTLAGGPKPNSGTNVNTKNPNSTRPCVGYEGGDPLNKNSYGYTLCSADTVTFRKVYGSVLLPFGLLVVGRQPVNTGTGIQAADGDGRPNRFGISRTGNIVDRVLFATKPLEALKPPGQRDTSDTEGLIFATAYDHLVTDSPDLLGDDVHQLDLALRFGAAHHPLGTDLFAAAYLVHRWDDQYKTSVNSVGGRAYSRFGPIQAGFDAAMNFGSTREVSEAYSLLTNDPVVQQQILAGGARGVVRLDHKLFSAYLEADYASGDGDPSARTPLTTFTFAEDTNVGLLLFENILAFQSARSSAAAVETLRRLGAASYPAEAIATRGSFTNAFAVFPQLDLHPHKDVLLRTGVMFAWAAAPVIDPVASLQRRDGLTIKDDLVNFAGGKPGRYYGTELDVRAQYRFLEHFAFDLEGAMLVPGDALRDEDGDAVRSVMLQARTSFFF